jgi:hypothetical protein
MRAATLLALVLLVLPGCQMNERMTGAAGGGLAGAVLGGALAETAGGVLLGGVGGAVAGYLIGDYLADRRERCLCQPAPAPSGSATDPASGRVAPPPAAP